MVVDRKNILTIVLSLAALTTLLFFLQNGATYTTDDPQYNRAYWTERLSTHDPTTVYEEFKSKNARAPFDLQHLAAHVMGEVFFEQLGFQGVSVCDPTFGFGCFHGFFTRAVSENGLSSVRDLDQGCLEKYGSLGTGCQHGIGHGIMEYLGYAHVEVALEACDTTTQVVPLLGCTSGVFMEYRKPLVISSDTARVDPRPFDEAHPYMPCLSVSDRFKSSCYFELGDWWRSTTGSHYRKMGELCAAVTPAAYAKDCFLGLGAIAAPTEEFDVAKTLMRCEEAGYDALSTRQCRSGAAWSFYANPEYRNEYRTLCDGLPAGEISACLKDSDLTEGREQRTL